MSRLYPMQVIAKQDWLGTKTEGPAKCGFEKNKGERIYFSGSTVKEGEEGLSI